MNQLDKYFVVKQSLEFFDSSVGFTTVFDLIF
jgi:hypothetical protein